jgi:hypothetical protein
VTSQSPISECHAKNAYQFISTHAKMHINIVTMKKYVTTNKSIVKYFRVLSSFTTAILAWYYMIHAKIPWADMPCNTDFRMHYFLSIVSNSCRQYTALVHKLLGHYTLKSQMSKKKKNGVDVSDVTQSSKTTKK